MNSGYSKKVAWETDDHKPEQWTSSLVSQLSHLNDEEKKLIDVPSDRLFHMLLVCIHNSCVDGTFPSKWRKGRRLSFIVRLDWRLQEK